MAEQVKSANVDDMIPEYMKDHAGEGQQMLQSSLATNYLQILQDLSDAVKNKVPGAEVGVWYASASQSVLGPSIEVIPIAFSEVWDEREVGGKTVDRFSPMGIEVTEQQNPKNPRYPKKVNPKTGNEIIETMAYALIIKNHPELGYLMHTAGVGSLPVYRRWNSMRSMVYMANGEQAPIFAKSWILTAGPRTSKTTGKVYYGLDSVEMGTWTHESVYQQAIMPAQLAARTTLMIAAPTEPVDGEIE